MHVLRFYNKEERTSAVTECRLQARKVEGLRHIAIYRFYQQFFTLCTFRICVLQGYSALRGPFVSSVVEQLLTGTRWGPLDYLLIDLPPGTGDIHITLTQQQVPLDGCVVITTPQVLRYVLRKRVH